MMKKTTLALAVIAGVTLAISQANAQLYVYEGFQYGETGTDQVSNPADPLYNLLHNQPDSVGGDVDATGLGGVWTDTAGPGAASDTFMFAGSLSFLDLPSSGNSIRTDTNQNNDSFTRPITAGVDAGSEMWFSFLASKLQNNFSAAEGGVVVGNQSVNTRILLNDGTDGLQGFGIAPTTTGNNWTAYAWDGSAQFVGDANYGVPTNGSQTDLLIGKVQFDAGTGGTDVFTAFYYNASAGSISDNVSNLVQIASPLEVNVDQTVLDTLNVTRQVNTAYDEIRIGGSLADVLGGAGGCNPGDTDGDGDIDTGDLTTSIQNFTGAGGSTTKTCEEGDTDEDGDVDTGDLTFSIQNFTGAQAGNAGVPDLVYDPATGNVTIDADGADVISFSLQSGPFNAADFSELPAGLTDNIASQIGWTSFNLFSGLTGTADLGAILPAGLDQAGLEAALTTASYGLALAGGGGGGRLDLIIPEPASMVLMALGAVALVRRRRVA